MSNTFDYTAFIGWDAKEVLQEYILKEKLSAHDAITPYNRRTSFNIEFQKLCQMAGVYERKKIVPSSMLKRLKNILETSGVRQDHICYLLGAKSARKEIITPFDEDLAMDFEKAFERLRIYPEGYDMAEAKKDTQLSKSLLS